MCRRFGIHKTLLTSKSSLFHQPFKMKVLIAIIALSLSSLAAAQPCTPGYYDAGAAGCKKCPLGTYQPDEGRSECKPCPDGHASMVEGAIECIPCGPNQEPTQFKDSCKCVSTAVPDTRGNCHLCKPGQYMFTRPNGKRLCVSCGPKEFQPEAGQTTCIACPRSLWSNNDRIACVECPEGEVLLDDVCGKCAPGQTLSGDSCVDCAEGSFKASEGQEPCLPCPRNSFSMMGFAKCITCPKGQALLKGGKCGSCPPGTYLDHQLLCKKCNKGTFSPDENIRGSCLYCQADSYSKEGASMCTTCAFGEGLMKDGSCGVCPPGTNYDSYKFRCQKCREGKYQPYENVMEECLFCSGETNSKRGATMCT